jgi:F0F1-type ATP synthase membrane subunit b/b'
MKEQDLLDLKQQIEDAKQSVAELKGEQTALLKQLKDNYKCTTIAEAEKKAQQMQAEIEKIQEQIDDGCRELEEKYDM